MEVKSLLPWPNKYCLMLKNCPYWTLVHVREKEKLKNCISAVRKKKKKSRKKENVTYEIICVTFKRERTVYLLISCSDLRNLNLC